MTAATGALAKGAAVIEMLSVGNTTSQSKSPGRGHAAVSNFISEPIASQRSHYFQTFIAIYAVTPMATSAQPIRST